jgi:serine/threonine protein kinase
MKRAKQIVSVVGDYRAIRLLGSGGMGAVYEAVPLAGGAPLALKLFSSAGVHSGFLRKRFVAEGRILARLDHPGLVKVRDIAIDGAIGAPYFTMNLVLGPDGEPCTLENLRRSGRLDERAIAALYGNLRDALAVTTTFAADRAPVMGSAGYLSPELKAGEKATPASDAYALGVVAFRLLTGVWYEEDSSAMDLLSGFDPAWTDVLGRLLSSAPDRRLPMPAAPEIGCEESRTGLFRRGAARFAAAAAAAAISTKGILFVGCTLFFSPRPAPKVSK